MNQPKKARVTTSPRRVFALFTIAAILLAFAGNALAQGGGLLTKDGRRLFPIGFYELPSDDAALRAMADAGVNLVRCHSKEELDRAQAAGLLGWLPIPVQVGASDDLRAKIESVKDHPALAVWEGPDEVVWNFTAASQLHRKSGVHKSAGAWWRQSPEAIQYAQEQAATLIPNMRAGVALVRELDPHNRPFWINEALRSDVRYVRDYMDFIDITGCDLYPVKHDRRDIASLGPATDRWKQVGRGKPVYMVLQAFSWHELGEYYGATEPAYPTFAESRFMAYDVICHGARGVLYWGSHYLKSNEFRQSLYALTSELAKLQPFLVSPDIASIRVRLIEMADDDEPAGSVAATVRRSGGDWLIVLVNEDDRWHMGVEVWGLHLLNGAQLHLLYGDDTVTVERGEFITRMPPLSVMVYATGREWESDRRVGRDFGEK